MPWRGPEHPTDFPTLGWEVLAWTFAHLPSPADESKPLVYTDSQAERVLRWYEIDPDTGEFVYETLILEEAKGSGKSPFAATLELVEFAGPACFGGWDSSGEPVAVPWGTGDRPPPWNQIAAVSEDQTENTYGALYEMLVANEHRAAISLGIDEGRTRLYLRGGRRGRLEPVTASAGSREGQRLTKVTLDETHLWVSANGGVRLARTLRRNVAKMGGRSVETTNAPVLGDGSVAEQAIPDRPSRGVLHYCRRPVIEPSSDWTDDQLREALAAAYGDAWWVDVERRVREIRLPTSDWGDSVRYWFNIRVAGAGRAVDPRRWDELRVDHEVEPGTSIGVGFAYTGAAVLRGCTPDGYSFTLGDWRRPEGVSAWQVPRQEVHEAVDRAFATYRVGRMLCDPPRWHTEIETWAEAHGAEVVLALPTASNARFAPAVDRWLTAIREGTHHHDGDPNTTGDVRGAHLRKVRTNEPEDQDRTAYVLQRGSESHQVAGAVVDVLALEAALTMPEAMDLEPMVTWV